MKKRLGRGIKWDQIFLTHHVKYIEIGDSILETYQVQSEFVRSQLLIRFIVKKSKTLLSTP